MTNEEAKKILEEYKPLQITERMPLCPRCGINIMNEKPTRNALSRHADIYICDTCGTDEAIRVYKGNPISLAEWFYIKHLKENTK